MLVTLRSKGKLLKNTYLSKNYGFILQVTVEGLARPTALSKLKFDIVIADILPEGPVFSYPGSCRVDDSADQG